MENGALGFALHPEFGGDTQNAGFVYVYYTVPIEEGRQSNRLVRFDVSGNTIQERNESEIVLIEQDRPGHGYHNAGDVTFGPDGFLYVSIGEAMYEPGHQTVQEGFFGGVFRIDIDMAGGEISHPIRNQPKDGRTRSYFVPNDNPFVGQPYAIEEYYALGLRNPFRIGFDQLTGQLWASENGEGLWEEIINVDSGDNCQYPMYEGPRRTKRAAPEVLIGTDKPPHYAYQHTALERSVIGGTVYRGEKYPDLEGYYLYGDGGSGRIYKLSIDDDADSSELIALAPFQGQAGLSSVYVTRQGDVLATVLGSHTQKNGRVLKLTPTAEAGDAPAIESSPMLANTSEHEFFVKNCATCHGNQGHGDGVRAKDLKKKPKDLTDAGWQTKVTDEHIFTVIQKGGGAGGVSNEMPGWMLMLEPDEISKMVAYIRTLKEK